LKINHTIKEKEKMISGEVNIQIPFATPVRMPNGLQWYEDELYVMDQLTDDVFVLNIDGSVNRIVTTETENGSGITVGGGFIWTASNGEASARPARKSDDHISKILKIDPISGCTVDYFLTPDGGGVHGLAWDDGKIWITAFNPRAIHVIDCSNYEIVQSFSSDLDVLHGLALDGDGIWCSDRANGLIVRMNKQTGEVTDHIKMPNGSGDPHGLTINSSGLWYSDADFPFADGMRGYPEIGIIAI
tara:strand:- start:4845 stop:5579 length:735 start_codon:yes stop_codon:yes gene_type:complete